MSNLSDFQNKVLSDIEHKNIQEVTNVFSWEGWSLLRHPEVLILLDDFNRVEEVNSEGTFLIEMALYTVSKGGTVEEIECEILELNINEVNEAKRKIKITKSKLLRNWEQSRVA